MAYADPQIVIIGEGVIEKVVDLLSDYRHPLLVTDEQIYSKYGTFVDEILGAKDEWLMVSDYEIGKTSISSEVDVVIGFGGGRSIDVAKLIARDHDFNWISIPTSASHDGIASDVASVSHNGYRYSVKCKSPIAVLSDLSIISDAPSRLRLAGIGDIICKTSSLAEWRLGHEMKDEPFDTGIFSFVNSALDTVLKDDGLDSIIRAQIDCGKAMSAFGSSRPCSGTEHAISHAMDRSQCDLHGLQVAFATPFCLYYLEKVGYAKHSAQEIRKFMQDRGMPTTTDKLNLTQPQLLDNINYALEIMRKRKRYSVLDHIEFTDQDLQETLRILEY